MTRATEVNESGLNNRGGVEWDGEGGAGTCGARVFFGVPGGKVGTVGA